MGQGGPRGRRQAGVGPKPCPLFHGFLPMREPTADARFARCWHGMSPGSAKPRPVLRVGSIFSECQPFGQEAARLNKPDRCRAVFRAQPPVIDTPRSRSRKSPRCGPDDIAPDRGCLARSATDRNTARSAHGSDRFSARARTRLARACSRRVCDRTSRSDWPRSGDRRGRAPSTDRSRRHSRCGRRPPHRPRDNRPWMQDC